MAMKIEKGINYWGSPHPMFRCKTKKDYDEIKQWMCKNNVEWFLWSSGSGGYIFDVRGDNAALFKLTWL